MVSPVTRRVPYRLFYRNLMSRLTFSNVPGKTYTCKFPDPPRWKSMARERALFLKGVGG